mgnify:CR=1 FL=1
MSYELHIAAKGGKVDVARRVIANKYVDERDGSKQTALHVAAANNQVSDLRNSIS